MLRSLRYFAVIGGLLLVISGCGKSPSDSDAESSENVVYAPMGTKIKGLDPGDISGIYAAEIASEIFECLYQYHYLKRPYELIPQLAESMPEISDDRLTYTIRIKKGVRYGDDECFPDGKGKDLVAGDFIYSWKRLANIKYLSRNWWVFDDKIVGLDEFREYTKTCKSEAEVDYSRGVEGLASPDDHTLIIKLKRPWPQLLFLLAHLPTTPMAKEAVDLYGKDILSHPVGTGPFKLKIWRRGSFIEMVRNANFRKDFYPDQGEPSDAEMGLLNDAGQEVPFVDRIVWILMEESQPRWLQFMRGKLDLIAIPKDNYDQAIDVSRNLTPEMKSRGIQFKKYRDPDTFWIGMNMEDVVLGKNKPLREAISYSIDKERGIEIFWNGRYEVAYGFIPPMLKAYDPQVKRIGKKYNPEKARELVKEAEKVHGGKLPTLKLSSGGADTLHRQMGQFYKQCMADVGLDVEVEFMDWPLLQEKVKSRSVQMFSMGWIADYPDTESFLGIFYSKNASPGTNNFNYNSPKFDKIYETVRTMDDSPERTELYRQAERVVIEDCPAAFTEHRVRYVLHHGWVGNYKPHVFPFGLWKYRRVDSAMRGSYKGK